jgi:NCS1 family nucleobase:cation symporter-1
MTSVKDSALGAEAADSPQHSIAPVPEQQRDSTALSQFWIWAGANIAPLNWILGALGIVLGLGFWDTVLVLAIGNAIGVTVFGFFVLMGQRTGVTQMVLSRSAFGRRGAYLPALLQGVIAAGWVGFNTWIVLDISSVLLEKIGLSTGAGMKLVLVVIIMLGQVSLAAIGFRAIRVFERWTVPPTLLVVLAMTIVAATSSTVDIGAAGTVSGHERLTAMSWLMTAIGIGWGITWLAYASDYSRFVPRSVPRRRLFLAAAAGQFVPVLWLGALGAALATSGDSADPSVLIVSNAGVLTIPVLLLVLHGPIATNIVNIYSTTMSALSLDLRVRRSVLALGIGVVGSLFAVYLIWADDLATQVNNWLSGLVAWGSAWAAIMFIHFYVVRQQEIDIDGLYVARSEHWWQDVNWYAMAAFAAGLVMAWCGLYGMIGPLQGPIARALDGLDVSWILGAGTAGTLYYAFFRLGLLDRAARASASDPDAAATAADGLAAAADGVPWRAPAPVVTATATAPATTGEIATPSETAAANGTIAETSRANGPLLDQRGD